MGCNAAERMFEDLNAELEDTIRKMRAALEIKRQRDVSLRIAGEYMKQAGELMQFIGLIEDEIRRDDEAFDELIELTAKRTDVCPQCRNDCGLYWEPLKMQTGCAIQEWNCQICKAEGYVVFVPSENVVLEKGNLA